MKIRVKVRVRDRVLKVKKILMLKVKIDIFEFLRLFKVSFVLRDSSRYEKSTSIIYFKNSDNYSKYYAKNYRIIEITCILL